MWDRIKQLWKKDTPPESPLLISESEQHALLDDAQQALQQGQYERAEQLARELSGSTLAEVAQQGLRLLGLVYFHQQRYQDAWPVFEQLAPLTGELSDWFNVVTSATLAGELQRGAHAFEQALKAHDATPETPALSAATMHHYYACALRDRNEHAKAFEHVQVLRALYEKLPQTDARLLQLRGFPSLEALLDMVADVLAHSGDLPEAQAWLIEFGQNLRGDTQAEIARAIERMQRVAPKQDLPPAAPAPTGPAVVTRREIPPPPAIHQDNDPRLD